MDSYTDKVVNFLTTLPCLKGGTLGMDSYTPREFVLARLVEAIMSWQDDEQEPMATDPMDQKQVDIGDAWVDSQIAASPPPRERLN